MAIPEITVTVTLNGTGKNPYAEWGLKGNPFPAIPRAEAAEANRILHRLAAGPLRTVDDVREILRGCDPALVKLCCEHFKAGESVSFNITFPDVWR